MKNNAWTGLGRNPSDVHVGMVASFSQGMKPAAAKAGLNIAEIGAALRQAWTTELLMATTRQVMPPEGRGASNNWTVVQAYYAIFHATRALAIASGRPARMSHSACQRFFHDWWATRSFKPSPWSLSFDVNGLANSSSQPTGITSNLATCTAHNCFDFVRLALKTTWDQELAEALRNARVAKLRAAQKAYDERAAVQMAKGVKVTGHRPSAVKLTPTERGAREQSVRGHTMIDYLYRLRLRSNYVDAAMWMDGPLTVSESVAVHDNLAFITASTLLACEISLRAILGPLAFDSIVSAFAATGWAAAPAGQGILARRAVLCV